VKLFKTQKQKQKQKKIKGCALDLLVGGALLLVLFLVCDVGMVQTLRERLRNLRVRVYLVDYNKYCNLIVIFMI